MRVSVVVVVAVNPDACALWSLYVHGHYIIAWRAGEITLIIIIFIFINYHIIIIFIMMMTN